MTNDKLNCWWYNRKKGNWTLCKQYILQNYYKMTNLKDFYQFFLEGTGISEKRTQSKMTTDGHIFFSIKTIVN